MKKIILSLFLFLLCLLPTVYSQTVVNFEADGVVSEFITFGSSLDGQVSPIIDNPNASGINTSSKVVHYTKAADAQTWGGAASVLPLAVDATNGGQICIKTHFDHIGNLALKLEKSTTGGEDWITTVANTKVNEWEELCFDLSAPSLEGSNAAASGHVYTQIVLFFDFGTAGTGTDVSYYFDDITYTGLEIIQASPNVTFMVDMNNYEGEFGTVYVSGTLNNWSGDANPLSDADGDGIWEGTIELASGDYEYKFTLDNWTGQEQFEGGEDCTITDPSGSFVNRLLSVGEGDDLFCYQWNSCMECGEDTGTGETVSCSTIFDFETPETSTDFQIFGSSLEASLTSVIANPNPNDVNASANVVEYIKAADAQTWGGMFAVNGVAAGIDATNGGQICVKVHTSQMGNLALKLEQSSTGGADWITTVANTKVNEWEELCFDLNAASIEDPFTPASGHVYNQVVLFFDFGTAGTGEDVAYYFDDMALCQAATTGPVDVTFSVNMNNYEGDFGQVYLSGEMNDWSGDANPMNDDDGDGIWTITLPLEPAAYEYKFTLDNWTGQEQFNGSETCTKMTVVDPDNIFVNRIATITSSTTSMPTFCFNSCYDCGESVNITFNLGMTGVMPAETGVFLAGGAEFGAPNPRFQLKDSDGDGVYSLTIEREKGYVTYYTFTNGDCQDFSCKENIAGQDCARPENFNDRWLETTDSDLEINTCFAECTIDTNCQGAAEGGNITFQVDMNTYDGAFETVYVSGTLNNWSGDANALSDEDGDGIWEGTLEIPGGMYEYKFTLDNWAAQEQFAGGEDCTITDPSGSFVNRSLAVNGDASLCYIWNTCDGCSVGIADLDFNPNLFQITPNLIETSALLTLLPSSSDKYLQVYNTNGQLIINTTIDGFQTHHELIVTDFATGIYIVSVQTDDTIATKRIVKK